MIQEALRSVHKELSRKYAFLWKLSWPKSLFLTLSFSFNFDFRASEENPKESDSEKGIRDDEPSTSKETTPGPELLHSSDESEIDEDYDDLVIDQQDDAAYGPITTSQMVKKDNRLYDEAKYLRQYSWIYYNLEKYGYMCKICEVFYGDQPCPTGRGRGAWSHNAVLLKENPKRRFTRHEKSKSHINAHVMKTSSKIEEAIGKADKESKKEKESTNELYVTKLIKIVHFLARNNLPVKELYPKMIKFMADEIEEPVTKQYLTSAAQNATYDSSDSCDSLLVSLDTYLKKTTLKRVVAAADIVLFADEATSVARKEMMGVFLSYFDEESKKFTLDFMSLVSVASTKSEILIEKMRSILNENGVEIKNTRFVCFDGTNSMSGEKNGVQRRYRNDAPFSIYVNCRCHR